jgi:chaperone BCS1
MTTNHITRLDEALIWPGRVDKKVELGLANNEIIANIFRLVFKPVKGDVALLEDDALLKDAQLGENRKVHEAIMSQRKEAKRVKRLAKEFTIKVPELKFSPTEIISFLLEYKKSPEEAINNIK